MLREGQRAVMIAKAHGGNDSSVETLFCRPAEFRSRESYDKALSTKLAYQVNHKKNLGEV